MFDLMVSIPAALSFFKYLKAFSNSSVVKSNQSHLWRKTSLKDLINNCKTF